MQLRRRHEVSQVLSTISTPDDGDAGLHQSILVVRCRTVGLLHVVPIGHNPWVLEGFLTITPESESKVTFVRHQNQQMERYLMGI